MYKSALNSIHNPNGTVEQATPTWAGHICFTEHFIGQAQA